MFPVAWLFLLHLHKIFLLQKPLAGFFPNSFHKKVPSVVWLLLQKQWSSGRTPETETVSAIRKNSFHAPREKGRVARAPTSATVKTNSLQSLQGSNTKKKKSKLLPHKQCRIPKLGKHASARTHQSPLSVSPKEHTPQNWVQSQKTGLNSGGSAPRATAAAAPSLIYISH